MSFKIKYLIIVTETFLLKYTVFEILMLTLEITLKDADANLYCESMEVICKLGCNARLLLRLFISEYVDKISP